MFVFIFQYDTNYFEAQETYSIKKENEVQVDVDNNVAIDNDDNNDTSTASVVWNYFTWIEGTTIVIVPLAESNSDRMIQILTRKYKCYYNVQDCFTKIYCR